MSNRPPDHDDDARDPVLVRRGQLRGLAATGKRIGYGLVAVATIAFFVGLEAGYEFWGPVVVGSLGASAVTLAPAIVLAYAVKAADREDRQERWR